MSIGEIIFFSVMQALAWFPCGRIVNAVRPRVLGLTLGVLALLACSGCMLMVVVLPLSKNYMHGPHATDLLTAWPLPFGVIGLFLVPTRKPTPPPNQCTCGYDLSGNVSGVCPECGRPVRKV